MKYWIALTACLAVLGGLAACGGDDPQVGGRPGAVEDLSEKAVNAWAENGATGLHNLLHPTVRDRCTVEGLDAVLADQPTPTGWRETKNIIFVGKSQATATVVVAIGGQDTEQSWAFELENNVRWRVTDFPGLAGCTT